MCRAPIVHISLDYEFANALNLSISPHLLPDAEPQTDAPASVKRVRVEHPAGMTITQRGQSCVITAMRSGNGAHRANLKVGDIILAVNGITVCNHATAIEIIESQSRVGNCELTVEKRHHSHFPTFARLLSIG